MPGLCESCRDPGACCRAVTVTGDDGTLGPATSELELSAVMAAAWLPFSPLFRHPDGVMVFWCAHLGSDGRCADYAHRPDLCRDYEAGSGAICVESPDFFVPRKRRGRAPG
jgi:Fe-S-cluster containining protein